MRMFGGRLAIVTGGGTGIGAATARVMAARGADVVIASRTQANLDETFAVDGGPLIEGIEIGGET